jgi:hypothetical protein
MKKNLFSLRLFLPHKLLLLTLCLSLLLGTTARPVRAAPTTFNVNRADDPVAPAGRTCTTEPNDCSLRGAILAANANSGADIINLPANLPTETYKLSLTGADDAAATGDLDITDSLTIIGAGAGVTTIDGNNLDRVFESRPTDDVTLTINISGVTITGGNVTGIGNIGAAFADRGLTLGITNLTMTEVVIHANTSGNNGGGIALMRNSNTTIGNPRLTLNRSTISGNTAINGGGIYCDGTGCTLNINNSAITGNTVTVTGGGIYIAGTTANVTLAHSTVSGNTANTNGGGIGIPSGTVLVNFSTITNNTADNDISGFGDGGGIYSNTGTTTIQNSIVQGNMKGGTPPTANDCAAGSVPITSGGYNVVGSDCPTGGTGDTTSAANLGTLADNGGPTLSHLPGAGSAAIDWVPNGGTCVAGTTTDQRSVVRGVDPASCDSGAIEADTTPAYRQCSLSVGPTYNMGQGVYLKINTPGSLGCVTITHYSTNHPNATPALQTGKYWNIDGAGATGFNVALTLPDTVAAPVICKYLGVGTDWNCNRNFQVDNGGSVTCGSVTSFSDWTVGDGPPTAVKLDYFGISQGSGLAGLGLLGAAVAIAMLAIALRRRKLIV